MTKLTKLTNEIRTWYSEIGKKGAAKTNARPEQIEHLRRIAKLPRCKRKPKKPKKPYQDFLDHINSTNK